MISDHELVFLCFQISSKVELNYFKDWAKIIFLKVDQISRSKVKENQMHSHVSKQNNPIGYLKAQAENAKRDYLFDKSTVFEIFL